MSAFPYAVVYRVTLNAVEVYAIAHAKRRPTYWRGRRFESHSMGSPTYDDPLPASCRSFRSLPALGATSWFE